MQTVGPSWAGLTRGVGPALLALALGLLVGAGCVGSIDDPEPFFAEEAAGDCTAADVPRILNQRCAVEGCHDSVDRAASLDLEGMDLEPRLVGVAAEEDGECTGRVLIDPADPTMSLLSAKVSTSPPCGDRMPAIGAFMSRSERRCLDAWIARAAERHGGGGGVDAGSDE